MFSRFSQYRYMWLFVFFDLPTETRKERKAATNFRNLLLKDGFSMFQYSIYLRGCSSRENAEVHEKRVRKRLPEYGKVGILRITDKQFGMMKLFFGTKPTKLPEGPKQLEMF